VKLPAVEAQSHRRFVKTCLPVDALVFSPKAKYVYIGRDGRNVVWSLYNHHSLPMIFGIRRSTSAIRVNKVT
jgi:aryl sulfotransferase